ncbi:MAG: hypothetical protein ACK521_06570 [bacterium]|jgi:hypothetical protein
MIKSKEIKKKVEHDTSYVDITDNEQPIPRGKNLNTSVASTNVNVTAQLAQVDQKAIDEMNRLKK